jgi:hypothetical protein
MPQCTPTQHKNKKKEKQKGINKMIARTKKESSEFRSLSFPTSSVSFTISLPTNIFTSAK